MTFISVISNKSLLMDGSMATQILSHLGHLLNASGCILIHILFKVVFRGSNVRKLPRATTNVQKNESYVGLFISYVGLFISYVGHIKSYVGLYNSYVGDKIS